MIQYIFILGRYPDLSRKEIEAVLDMQKIVFTPIESTNSLYLIQTPNELSIEKLNQTLGGTVKIGRIIHTLPLPCTQDALENYLTSDVLFSDILSPQEDKVNFGISFYSASEKSPLSILSLLRAIKIHLEAQGFRARFPDHRGPVLSSASVGKNKLLTTGAELLLIQSNKELLIGKTLAIQEFEAFSQRDYGRPARDMDSGIMPPKIARMMLNLAEVPHDQSIIDPFCGSGTMLQEATLLGYTDVTGTDNSDKALKDTKQNLKWLNEKQKITVQPRILKADVTTLSKTFSENTFSAVITEPYMGPNLQQRPSIQLIQQNQIELTTLYLSALTEFIKVLKPDGVIVMILPVFHLNRQFLSLDILNDAEKLGLIQIPLSKERRQTILVGNRYDFVLREIVKFSNHKKDEILRSSAKQNEVG
ncbi:MAG: methyltransferase domain-containing protein [Patescibacteria group bacterium]